MRIDKTTYEESVAYARTFCSGLLVDVLDWNVQNGETFHDCSVTELHVQQKDPFAARTVTLTVLGAHWDREYILEFSDVLDCRFNGLQIPPGQNVSSLLFEPSSEKRKCRIHFLGTDNFAELEFSKIAFQKRMLAKPIARRMG